MHNINSSKHSEQTLYFYRFKTFTTSYFFPPLVREQKYMYALYSAYGGRLSRIYWWLFRHCAFIRCLTRVDERRLPFPFEDIRRLAGHDCLMAFNMGSPGVERKISILGWDYSDKQPFFAKYSQSEVARQLTKNEVEVYRQLGPTGLTPRLLKYEETDKGSFMMAEYIEGKRPPTRNMTDEILQFCLQLKEHRLPSTKDEDASLQTSLSHGDFCPWNMLVKEGRLQLIDWEMAANRPLGYDLFTFICQVSHLFEPEKPLAQAVEENDRAVKDYFEACGITDPKPYLRSFAADRICYEESKGNSALSQKYKELLQAT